MAYETELHAERREEQQDDSFWSVVGSKAEWYSQQVPDQAEFGENNKGSRRMIKLFKSSEKNEWF